MGFEAPVAARPGRDDEAVVGTQDMREECIGAPLEQARLRLLGLIDNLDDVLGEFATPLLEAARKQLKERACRIAVVGQIKAGKSTFINALSERPDFLPADINPWTAVVTSMHFRASPTPPDYEAAFHLFSADEWNELATGSGRLRELTERLVPGFQPDLLRAQLEVMRKRAERRLGAKFAQLLGECHRYETITPELLADYVSAGDDTIAVASRGTRRLYSDITRSADLYFSHSPFAFPVTLIDTPGTNDPFLVRDEITRRSLETPDIYIFVISALQPLSASDISMLRLLNGLHKDRIVVFINRADQLPNPASDAAAIKTAVETRLRQEFPALQIPVICGSAWMGNLRLQTGDGDLHARLKPAQVKALRQAGLLAPVDAAPSQLSTAERSRVAEAMHMSSGMREVSAAVTRLMCTSSIAMLLRQIAVCLAELVKSADASDRAELASIRGLLEARRREASAHAASIAEERQSLASFQQRAASLQTSFASIETHFNQLVETSSQLLRHELSHQVRTFADTEADTMLNTLDANPRLKHWRCDVVPLRERLLATYMSAFDQTASDLSKVEQFLYPQLKVIVASLLPGYNGSLLEVPAWPVQAAPSVGPLTDKVEMVLASPLLTRWFGTRRTVEERADDLRRLIETEFLRIADDLVAATEKALGERIEHILQRINAIGSGLHIGTERRAENLAREEALLDSGGDGTSLAAFEADQQQRIAECERKQEACTLAIQEIAAALQVLDAAESRV
jgi:signal recognition particle receptor subunit beta